MTELTYTDLDRFIEKVELPDDDGCWTWTGAKHSKTRGYGKFRLAGKVMNAHKAAYLLFKGEVEAGKVIAHQCNNEECVNPAHLRLETQSENLKYAYKCGRLTPPRRTRQITTEYILDLLIS